MTLAAKRGQVRQRQSRFLAVGRKPAMWSSVSSVMPSPSLRARRGNLRPKRGIQCTSPLGKQACSCCGSTCTTTFHHVITRSITLRLSQSVTAAARRRPTARGQLAWAHGKQTARGSLPVLAGWVGLLGPVTERQLPPWRHDRGGTVPAGHPHPHPPRARRHPVPGFRRHRRQRQLQWREKALTATVAAHPAAVEVQPSVC